MDFQLPFDRLNVNLDDSEVERQWKLINVFSCKLIIIISIEIASFIINYCMNNGFNCCALDRQGQLGLQESQDMMEGQVFKERLV